MVLIIISLLHYYSPAPGDFHCVSRILQFATVLGPIRDVFIAWRRYCFCMNRFLTQAVEEEAETADGDAVPAAAAAAAAAASRL